MDYADAYTVDGTGLGSYDKPVLLGLWQHGRSTTIMAMSNRVLCLIGGDQGDVMTWANSVQPFITKFLG